MNARLPELASMAFCIEQVKARRYAPIVGELKVALAKAAKAISSASADDALV